MQKLAKVSECYSAELIGNYLYVAARLSVLKYGICCYDIVHDIWSTLPPIPFSSDIQIGSLCHIEDHLYAIYKSSAPYRYHIATNQWQSVASSKAVCDHSKNIFCNKAAAVYKSYLYVLHGQGQIQKDSRNRSIFCSQVSLSVLFCFDPKKNVWDQRASTKTPHFGSFSLLVVNNNLYVAGGRCSLKSSSSEPYDIIPAGGPAAIEVYNDQENAWSVVEQMHIPPNNLGAVEIDGRVYFIINSFPVDSGITIPAGEVYPVILDEWENLRNIRKDAVLCYVPVKTENLTTENEYVDLKS